MEHDLPAEREQILRGLDAALAPGSPALLWLGFRAGRPVAIALAQRVVSVEKGGEALWLEELYVVPEARRTGVARALVERLIAEARHRGLQSVELEVFSDHAPARALYAQAGFAGLNRIHLSLDLD